MKNFFDQYPEFIDSDTRLTRTNPKDGYPVDADFLQKRYSCTVPAAKCHGKKILDLGSCTASLGAWCLANGASSYTGVELQKKFVAESRDNLSKYFSKGWQIIESTVENFLEHNTKHYDIVVAAGVIYGVDDMHGCLKKLAKISDYLIIEAKHPTSLRQMSQKFPALEKSLELKQAVIEVASMPMVSEEANHKAWSLGFNPSIGALILIFQSLDFGPDTAVYDNLKSALGDIYGLSSSTYFRYGIGFQKQVVEHKLLPFAEVYQDPELLKQSLKEFE
jgi:precorrin-6B methylase 2